MVVPVTETGRCLLVKDKKTSEWGFISGGVKKNEKMFYAANRELCEETSNVLTKISKCHTLIRFKTTYRPTELLLKDKKNNEHIISIYHVYLFLIREDDVCINKFNINKEVSDIKICRYDDTENRWAFCDMVYNSYIKNYI
jgi:8-oxo-dGTP pyrophosphatase MutT (NUDIX family)